MKTEPAGGDRQVIDLVEDIEGTDPAEYAGEEEETEAEDTVVVVVEGEAKGTGKPKVGEDTDDDAVDVVTEEIESGNEEEGGEDNDKVRVQVAGIDLVVSGPHDPEGIIGKRVGTRCTAKDRQRVHRDYNRTAVGEISYEATLGPHFV